MSNHLPPEIVIEALRCFVEKGMSTREVAKHCKIGKATAHRIQRSLLEPGADPLGTWVSIHGEKLKFIPYDGNNP